MIDIDGKQEWRDCVDVPGVRLPRGYYFGTSAATGDLTGRINGDFGIVHTPWSEWYWIDGRLYRILVYLNHKSVPSSAQTTMTSSL